MAVPLLRVFEPTGEGLKKLWLKFDEHRDVFPDTLPKDPFSFITWIARAHTRTILVGGDENDIDGVFIFEGITEGDSAWAHVFLWGRDKYTPAELTEAGRLAVAGIMVGANLRRVLGAIAATSPHAVVFAQRVGMTKVGEFTEAIRVKGKWVNAVLLEILRPKIEEVLRTNGRDTIE